MDNSHNLTLNISESDTMGNILQSTNESKDPASENSKVADSEASALTVLNTEVSNQQNLASNTFKNVAQDVSLSKDVGSVDEWLQGDTKHLVKVEADEDFEGIVKSLETAIVETQNYDMETDFSSRVCTSISNVRGVTYDGERVLTSESLMGELSKDLNRSPEPQFVEILTQEQVILDTDLEPDEAPVLTDNTEFISVSSEVRGNFISIERDMANFAEDQTNSIYHNSTENSFSEAELSVLGLPSTMSADIPVEIGHGILRQPTVNMRNNLEIDPELSESSSIIYSTGDEATNDGILNPTSELQKSSTETQEQKNIFSSRLKVEDNENNKMVEEILIGESNLKFKSNMDISKEKQIVSKFKIEATEKCAVLEEKLISESIVEETEEEMSFESTKEETEKEISSVGFLHQTEKAAKLEEKISNVSTSKAIEEDIVLEEIITSETAADVSEKDHVLEERISNEFTAEKNKEDNSLEDKIASDFIADEFEKDVISNATIPDIPEGKLTSEFIAGKINYVFPPEKIENNVVLEEDISFEPDTKEKEKDGVIGTETSKEVTLQTKTCYESTANDPVSCSESISIEQESVELSKIVLEQDENMKIQIELEVLDKKKVVEKSIDDKNDQLKPKKNIPSMENEIQKPESLREEELAINALLEASVEDTHELELEEETINFSQEAQDESISMREEDIAIRSLFTPSVENSNSPSVYEEENIENDTTEEQRDILQLREEEIAIRNLLTESANDSVESNMEFEDENILSIEEALEEPVPEEQLEMSSLLIKSVETIAVPESEMELKQEENINAGPAESEEDIAVRNLLIETDIENSTVQEAAMEQEESMLLTEEEIAVNNLLAECNIETEEHKTEEDTIMVDRTSESEINTEVIRLTVNNENVTKETIEVPEVAKDTVLQDVLEDKDVVLEEIESEIPTDQSIKIVIIEGKVKDGSSDNNVHESIDFSNPKHRIEEIDTSATKEIESNINKKTSVAVLARDTITEIQDKSTDLIEDLPHEKIDKTADDINSAYLTTKKINVVNIESDDILSEKISQKLEESLNKTQKLNPVIYKKNIAKYSDHLKENIEKDNKSTLLMSDKMCENPICELGTIKSKSYVVVVEKPSVSLKCIVEKPIYELGENKSESDTIIVEKPNKYFKNFVEKSKPSTSQISENIIETSTKNVENYKKSDSIMFEKISDIFNKNLEQGVEKNIKDSLVSEKLKFEKLEKVADISRDILEENVENNKNHPLISEKIAKKLRKIEEIDMHDEQIEKSTSHSPQKVKLVRQRFPKVGTVKVQSIKPQTASHGKKVETIVQASTPEIIAQVQKPVILSEISKPADNIKTEIKVLEAESNSPNCDVPEEKPILDETKLAIIEQFLEDSEDEVKTPVKPQKLKLKRNYQPPLTIIKPKLVKEIIQQKKIVKDKKDNPDIVRKEQLITLQSAVLEAVPDMKNQSIIVKKDVQVLSSKKEDSIALQSAIPEAIHNTKIKPVIVKKDVKVLCSKNEESVTCTVPETVEEVKDNPIFIQKNVEVLGYKKEASVSLQFTVSETIEDMKNNPVIVKKDVEALYSKKEKSFTLQPTVPETTDAMKNKPEIAKKDVESLCSKKEELTTLQFVIPVANVDKCKAIISESSAQEELKDGAHNIQPLTKSNKIIDIIEKHDVIIKEIDLLPENYKNTDITTCEEVKMTKLIKEVRGDEKYLTINQVLEEQSKLISKIPEVNTIKEFEVTETTEIRDDIANQDEIPIDEAISKESISSKDKIEEDAIIVKTCEMNKFQNLKIVSEDYVLSERILETSDFNDTANVINELKIIDVFTIEDKSSSVDLSDRINTATPEIQNVEEDESEPLSVVENVPGIHLRKITTSQTKTSTIHFPLLMSRLQDKLDAVTKTSKVKLQQEMSNKQKANLIELPHIEIKPEQVVLPTTSAHISPRSKEITKLRSSQKRKHSPDVSSRQAITKPLSVEVDDLETSDANYETVQHSLTPTQKEHENIRKIVMKHIPRPEKRSSPKITIKPIKPPSSPEVSSKKMKHSDESSPTRLTIKSSNKQEPLKITFTKQKTDDTHSILKIYQPEDHSSAEDIHVPRMSIKPHKQKSDEMQHSPKITIKPVKPPISPKVTVKPVLPPSDPGSELTSTPKSSIIKSHLEESYPKVTIKPVLKPEESNKSSHLTHRQIKLKSMTFDSSSGVTVEPVCGTSSSFPNHKFDHDSHIKMSSKSYFISEESSTSKLSIKPITKTCEIVQSDLGSSSPLKLTIKPLKSEESYQSPKITIKPIVKPDELEETDKPERIILKIQKTNLHSPKERSSTHVKESKREPEIKIDAIPHHEMEKNQKLDKIKLKLTKEGGHAQIIPTVSQSMHTETLSLKRSLGISETTISEKRIKSEFSDMFHSADVSINIVEPNCRPHPKQITEEVTIMKIENTIINKPSTSQHISQMKFKEMLMKISQKPDITCIRHVPTQREDSSSSDDVKIVEVLNDPLADPLTLQEDSSSQDVLIVNEIIDTNPFKNVQIIDAHTISDSPVQQSPKRRGRPRKNPLEVKPEIKGEDCIELDATRPKRTCRAPAGRTPFAIKERKPRGAGRGRGSPRGARGAGKTTLQKIIKETKASRAKALKEAKALAKLEAVRLSQEVVIDEITIEDTTNDTSAATPVSLFEDSLKKSEVKEPEVTIEMVEPVVEPEPDVETEPDPECTKGSPSPIKEEETSPIVEEESAKQPDPPVAVYEDETRMSASENSSRAQTPARQDVFIVPFPEGHEESQSSVQSTATTESNKTKKVRLELCDPDSTVTTVEQVVEYSWANGGPYMLQEQIAQYLGVKSFKRKYPGLNRRPVEMQERDYIREKGLVSESMCDMGLTAVPSSEILDIMYSDFQEKYEEYRKCLRDRQSKEISNKQRAISLATTQEKNKLDFKERAIRSAQNWNSNFNKVRKENRKCCMDLQTFTVNYPSGVMQAKVPHKTPVGHYPVALVPGQYTDYWKNYNSSDLNYLPLNTVRFGPMLPNKYTYDGGQSDGSSESDSSSGSDSDSSDESMSTEDEAPPSSTPILLKTPTVQLTPLLNSPKK